MSCHGNLQRTDPGGGIHPDETSSHPLLGRSQSTNKMIQIAIHETCLRGYEFCFKNLIMHTYLPVCLNIFRSVSDKKIQSNEEKNMKGKFFGHEL